jgi:hypothetical protein
MKQKDVEGADTRYATKVEVDDLKRTFDDFMKSQEAVNKSVNSKLKRLLKLLEDSDITLQDPFSVDGMENADREDCPWSASELEAFYDKVYEPIKPPAQPKQPQS